jgi:hypothetical protein
MPSRFRGSFCGAYRTRASQQRQTHCTTWRRGPNSMYGSVGSAVRECRRKLKTGSHPLKASDATGVKPGDSIGAGSRASQQQVTGLLGSVQPVESELLSAICPIGSPGQQQPFGVPAAADPGSSASARHQPPGNASDKTVTHRMSAVLRSIGHPARRTVQKHAFGILRRRANFCKSRFLENRLQGLTTVPLPPT